MKRRADTLLFHGVTRTQPFFEEWQSGFDETQPAQLAIDLVLPDADEKYLAVARNTYLPAPVLLARPGMNLQVCISESRDHPARQVLPEATRVDEVRFLLGAIESIRMECDVRSHHCVSGKSAA